MTEPTHTPGPWVQFCDQGETAAILPAMRDGQICDFASTVRREDARLIAAAPDMLDALRQWKAAETMKDFDELRNAKASRDAAIAKATGEA